VCGSAGTVTPGDTPDDWRTRSAAPPPTHGDTTRVQELFRQAREANVPVVPGYEILETLGRGGMGVVYKARQVALDRIVALKMLLAGPWADAAQRARFRAEAEAAARLQHPNIVQIYEVGESEGLPYFALEYVAGGTLAQHIGRVPQAGRDAARVLVPIARAI